MAMSTKITTKVLLAITLATLLNAQHTNAHPLRFLTSMFTSTPAMFIRMFTSTPAMFIRTFKSKPALFVYGVSSYPFINKHLFIDPNLRKQNKAAGTNKSLFDQTPRNIWNMLEYKIGNLRVNTKDIFNENKEWAANYWGKARSYWDNTQEQRSNISNQLDIAKEQLNNHISNQLDTAAEKLNNQFNIIKGKMNGEGNDCNSEDNHFDSEEAIDASIPTPIVSQEPNNQESTDQ